MIGMSFAADIIKLNRQISLVLRETVSSYTVASLIENEKHDTFRDALVRFCKELQTIDGFNVVIRRYLTSYVLRRFECYRVPNEKAWSVPLNYLANSDSEDEVDKVPPVLVNIPTTLTQPAVHPMPVSPTVGSCEFRSYNANPSHLSEVPILIGTPTVPTVLDNAPELTRPQSQAEL